MPALAKRRAPCSRTTRSAEEADRLELSLDLIEALVPDTELGRRLVRAIDHPDIAFTRDLAEADVDAVLFAGPAPEADALRRELAERGETIVPLVMERTDGSYDLYRLVIEKVASINTTAAGGNAALMSLEEGLETRAG